MEENLPCAECGNVIPDERFQVFGPDDRRVCLSCAVELEYPTTKSPHQIKKLLNKLQRHWDVSYQRVHSAFTKGYQYE